MYFELTASMMCANYGNLENEIKQQSSSIAALILSTSTLWTDASCQTTPCL